MFLAVEMIKVIISISLTMEYALLYHNGGNYYSLRNLSDFSLPIMKTMLNEVESYLGPKI